MKSKISLILGIVVLFLSVPFIMGNGNTEVPRDKEAIQKELDQCYNAVMEAYDKMCRNKEEWEKVEADNDKMKEILAEEVIILFSSHPDKLPDIDELAAILDEKSRVLGEEEAALAEHQARMDKLEDEYFQYEQNEGPGYFESEEALKEWIDNNQPAQAEPKTTAEKINLARRMQAAGLSDGYIINVNFFHNQATGQYEVTCSTNVKGTIHSWEAGSSDAELDTRRLTVLRNFRSVKELEDWMKANIKPMDLEDATLEELEKIGEEIKEAAADDGYIIKLTTNVTDHDGIVKYKAYCHVDAGDHSCIWTVGKTDLTIVY